MSGAMFYICMGLLLRYRNAFNVNTFVFSLVMSLSYFHHYTSSLSLYKCSFNNLIAGLAIRFAFYKGFILVNNLKWYYETWRFFSACFFFQNDSYFSEVLSVLSDFAFTCFRPRETCDVGEKFLFADVITNICFEYSKTTTKTHDDQVTFVYQDLFFMNILFTKVCCCCCCWEIFDTAGQPVVHFLFLKFTPDIIFQAS